ncbi:MAG: YceI family protein [Gammaproteobacteria bacterium]|nr:YceI family protein [Gammaproteobacteria bacterium]
MRKTVQTALLTTFLALAANAQADLSDVPSGEYGLDDHHAYISFTYSHIGYSTPHIGFRNFDANLMLDSENPQNSEIEVVIDTTSIDSRVDEFNGHLRGSNFFDTDNYPQATFKSTRIEGTGEDTFNVTGDLTIKDVTKSVTLEATLNKAAMHPMRKIPAVGFSAETTIMRSDFGLDRAVPAVGDEVTIYITVEMPKKESD